MPSVINTKKFIKDPYVLEFLDLPENVEGRENTLESALISNLQKFSELISWSYVFQTWLDAEINSA